MLMSASRPLVAAHRAVGARGAVVEQHHVVLDHAEPARLGIPSRSRWVLASLHRLPLLDVGAAPVQPGLLVVPEDEAERAPGPHIGRVEDARELQDQRGARAVVVRGLAPAMPVHMGTEDVHLRRMRGADGRAIDLLPRARRRGLLVQLAQPGISLCGRIRVDSGSSSVAEDAATTGTGAVAPDLSAGRGAVTRVEVAGLSSSTPLSWHRFVHVIQARRGRAPDVLQPFLNPINRVAISLCPLAPIAELGQTLERRFVTLEGQTSDQRGHGTVDGFVRLARNACRPAAQRQGEQPDRGADGDLGSHTSLL